MRQNKKALTSFLENETVELKLDYTDSTHLYVIPTIGSGSDMVLVLDP